MATNKTTSKTTGGGAVGAGAAMVLGEGPVRAAGEAATDAAPVGPVRVKPVPEPVWPVDEFTGVGGRYVRDPVTGVRRPADPDEVV